MRWTHKDGSNEHQVEPMYNGSGWMFGEQPSYWVCHKCRGAVLLDGMKPPITVPAQKGKEPKEGDMSGQP